MPVACCMPRSEGISSQVDDSAEVDTSSSFSSARTLRPEPPLPHGWSMKITRRLSSSTLDGASPSAFPDAASAHFSLWLSNACTAPL